MPKMSAEGPSLGNEDSAEALKEPLGNEDSAEALKELGNMLFAAKDLIGALEVCQI
jgi:hypothetical protein